jgi:hypothetical protein
MADYPISLLYVQTAVQVPEGGSPEAIADDAFEQLEAMLRLFQEGRVFLRRHTWQEWTVEEGKPIILNPPSPKPLPGTLYHRKSYKIDNETLREFVSFFNRFWDVVHEKHQPIFNALHRFNASYET